MTSHPSMIVRTLFEEAKRRRIPVKAIGPMLRHSTTSIYMWKRRRTNPRLAAVEAFADALDMELALVPKKVADDLAPLEEA